MVIFKINNTDYASHILAGTYKISRVELLDEWVDASYTKHSRVLKRAAAGTFDMFFRTKAECDAFMADIEAVRNEHNAIPLDCSINNDLGSTLPHIEAFLTFSLTRDRDGAWADYYKKFTVKLEER